MGSGASNLVAVRPKSFLFETQQNCGVLSDPQTVMPSYRIHRAVFQFFGVQRSSELGFLSSVSYCRYIGVLSWSDLDSF